MAEKHEGGHSPEPASPFEKTWGLKFSSELRCSCGAQFKTAGRLGRHVQKWNSRHDLRGRKLIRG